MIFWIIWTIIATVSLLILLVEFMFIAGTYVYYVRHPENADEVNRNNIKTYQQDYPRLTKVLWFLGTPLANWIERLES